MKAPSKSRALFILGSLGLCVIFHSAFTDFLSTRWEYYGFVFANKSTAAIVTAYSFSMLPSLWIPYVATRPSIPIVWFLYAIVFIPSMFCLALVSPSLDRTLPLLISLLVGFSIMIGGYYLRLSSRRTPRQWLRPAPEKAFIAAVWIMAAIMLAATAFTYRDSLAFPTAHAIYDVRLSARAVQQDSPLAKYFPQWLTRCLLPFMLATTLFRRRYWLVVPILLAHVVLFMATAHKVYFIVPVVVGGLFLILRLFPQRPGVAFMFSLVAVAALTLLIGSDDLRDLLFMRTMGWSGLASYMYDDFIRFHDVTLWSHIKGVSAFVANPYSETIPFVIGYEYFRNPDLTLNAHFWAMDGIMAAGNLGVLAISVVAATLLSMIDRIGARVLPAIAIPWMGAYATSLGDAGLFSALLTGGLGFAMLMLAALPVGFRVAPAPVASAQADSNGGRRLLTSERPPT